MAYYVSPITLFLTAPQNCESSHLHHAPPLALADPRSALYIAAPLRFAQH